ncbi:tetratricopeptide repeat protein [Planctomyces sp. SH-PL62]|uniref:tetratricopeptide repeat protein n=1 Tax=Planctomyces sp. SH-PL62 TaxID=1636152 RepID=UPI00078CEA86|nr:tetratricopeptide repeat protein [Planctomyces sp. SH-PL62]AMV40731.1 Thioredoxin [Planctomyces sp. SH-PL62]
MNDTPETAVPTPPSDSPYILDATTETFAADVVERSKTTPVVVDVWATWCGPCKLLGPVLEKLAREYDGKFVLVKVDSDRSPEIAANLRVRSIPTVFGVRDGQILDSFAGVQSESFLRQWLDRLLPSKAESLVNAARALEASDPEAAGARFAEALTLDPDLTPARVGLARLAMAAGRFDEAQAAVLELERRGFLEPEAEKLKAELVLKAQAEGGSDVDSARARAEASPADKTLKLRLAEALAAAGSYDEALAIALDLVETDRKTTGEAARKLMLAVFQLLPDDSATASEFRRRLSFAL